MTPARVTPARAARQAADVPAAWTRPARPCRQTAHIAYGVRPVGASPQLRLDSAPAAAGYRQRAGGPRATSQSTNQLKSASIVPSGCTFFRCVGCALGQAWPRLRAHMYRRGPPSRCQHIHEGPPTAPLRTGPPNTPGPRNARHHCPLRGRSKHPPLKEVQKVSGASRPALIFVLHAAPRACATVEQRHHGAH